MTSPPGGLFVIGLYIDACLQILNVCPFDCTAVVEVEKSGP